MLGPTTESRSSFPFAYTFTVKYDFSETQFRVQLALENLGDRPIPWCAGHHFYFSIPWEPDGAREKYVLFVRAARSLRQDPVEGSLSPAATPKPTGATLDDPALIDTIHCGPGLGRTEIRSLRSGESIGVIIGDGDIVPESTAVVTWTETPTSPFYCVEPWMGPPNASAHGLGLRWVPPGGMDHFLVTVTTSGGLNL